MLISGIYRKFIEKSGSKTKIRYLRKRGMIIGKNCTIETLSFSTEPYLIEIGDNVGISDGTVFITHDAGIHCFDDEFPGEDVFGRIIIGNNVFIGINCTILPNTFVGNNSIIGAGSVVRGRFPEESVIIGNPAKVMMKMSTMRFLFRQNSGRLRTRFIHDYKKAPIVKSHFNIK